MSDYGKSDEMKKVYEIKSKTLPVIQAQWVASPVHKLSEEQQNKLHIRLREYLESDEFLEGIVQHDQMQLSFARVVYGEVDLDEVLNSMPEDAAAEFRSRLNRSTGMIQ